MVSFKELQQKLPKRFKFISVSDCTSMYESDQEERAYIHVFDDDPDLVYKATFYKGSRLHRPVHEGPAWQMWYYDGSLREVDYYVDGKFIPKSDVEELIKKERLKSGPPVWVEKAKIGKKQKELSTSELEKMMDRGERGVRRRPAWPIHKELVHLIERVEGPQDDEIHISWFFVESND